MKDLKLEIKYIQINELNGYINNTKEHPQTQIDHIKASIKEFGMCNPIGIHNNTIIFGHGRWEALKQLKYEEVPTVDLSHLTEAQKKALIIADNKIAEDADWNEDLLQLELMALDELDFDYSKLGLDFEFDEIEEMEDYKQFEDNPTLAERFGVPPFSVMDTRQGYWRDRKRYWKQIVGIESEKGRGENVLGSSKKAKGDWGDVDIAPNSSIFDPVIAEVFYNWYSKEGDIILDPFAGGSVRGIVASKLNRNYIGGELREEQVKENIKQAKEIIKENEPTPLWINDDSANIKKNVNKKVNMIFSCPPYADLEVYSDNPKDLSTMKYEDFIKAYRYIIKESCDILEDNSFACFVVGEVRDKKGDYYNFVGDTIRAFKDAGLKYYVEAILVEQSGTGAMRAGKLIKASRKLVKTHQNILVFVKGDGKEATKKFSGTDLELREEL